jgi:hypothetical protein
MTQHLLGQDLHAYQTEIDIDPEVQIISFSLIIAIIGCNFVINQWIISC